MPFDPNKPFQTVSSTKSFDPSKPFNSVSSDPTTITAKSNPTMTDSAVRGGIQGASFGFGDEIKGGLNTLIDQIKGDPRSIIDNYRTNRDIERQADEQAKLANPKSYLAGQVVGGIGSSIVLPGGLIAQGAAQGLGDSNADLTKGEVGGAALDTGIGGAVGGVLANGGKILGKAADVASELPGIKQIVESRYGKALAGGNDVSQYGKPGVQEALAADVAAAKSTPLPSIEGPGYIVHPKGEGAIGPDLQSRLDDLNTYKSFDNNGGILQKGAMAAGAIGGLAHGSPVGAAIGYKGAQEAFSGEAQRAVLTSVGAVKNALVDGINKLPPQLKAMSQSAAEKGGNSLAVQHFIMSQRDPNYAKAFSNTTGDSDNDEAAQPSQINGSF